MRCRNCVHFSELAAKDSGVCNHPTNDVEYPAKKLTTSTDSCEKFEPKHPARRRTLPPVKPSADAECISAAIQAAAERVAQAIERTFTNPEGSGTAWDALSDLVTIAERIADATD